MQQSLKPLEFELDEDENENEADLIQKLIENAMPERKKVKKTQDVDMQAIEGGGMIYIPKKRKRKTILPKGYNPENPGPMPDPERWLPKW